jgi:N-acetylneuraminic acid mutarotase
MADIHMRRRFGLGLTRAHLIVASLFLAALVVGWAYFAWSPLAVCDAAEELPVWEGQWTRGAPMPTARSEVGAAMLDGRLYVAGGLGGSGATDAFEVYDTATAAWRSLPPLPGGPLHHAGLAAAGNLIILTGGYSDLRFTPTRAAWAFDPAAESWRRLANLLAPLGAHTSQGVQGAVYVFGGAPGGDIAWRYDLAADAWEQLAPMADHREHLASGVLDGTIVVAGGRWGDQNSQAVAGFSTDMDQWMALPDMPTARGGIGAAVLDGRLYVAGGEEFSAQCTFDRVEVFDGERWMRTPPMPEPRHGLAAAADGNALYIVGGATRAQAQTLASAADVLLIFRPGD